MERALREHTTQWGMRLLSCDMPTIAAVIVMLHATASPAVAAPTSAPTSNPTIAATSTSPTTTTAQIQGCTTAPGEWYGANIDDSVEFNCRSGQAISGTNQPWPLETVAVCVVLPISITASRSSAAALSDSKTAW